MGNGAVLLCVRPVELRPSEEKPKLVRYDCLLPVYAVLESLASKLQLLESEIHSNLRAS